MYGFVLVLGTFAKLGFCKNLMLLFSYRSYSFQLTEVAQLTPARGASTAADDGKHAESVIGVDIKLLERAADDGKHAKSVIGVDIRLLEPSRRGSMRRRGCRTLCEGADLQATGSWRLSFWSVFFV